MGMFCERLLNKLKPGRCRPVPRTNGSSLFVDRFQPFGFGWHDVVSTTFRSAASGVSSL